jgi:hypothetical protein
MSRTARWNQSWISAFGVPRREAMTEVDCERAQQEIDQLLNDLSTPMSPARIWALAEAIAGCDEVEWMAATIRTDLVGR